LFALYAALARALMSATAKNFELLSFVSLVTSIVLPSLL
jgi:hypothetical protein